MTVMCRGFVISDVSQNISGCKNTVNSMCIKFYLPWECSVEVSRSHSVDMQYYQLFVCTASLCEGQVESSVSTRVLSYQSPTFQLKAITSQESRHAEGPGNWSIATRTTGVSKNHQTNPLYLRRDHHHHLPHHHDHDHHHFFQYEIIALQKVTIIYVLSPRHKFNTLYGGRHTIEKTCKFLCLEFGRKADAQVQPVR